MVLVCQTIRIGKMGPGGTNRHRLFIHHLNKPAIGTTYRFRHRYSCVISGNKHHAIQQFMKRNRHVTAKPYICSVLPNCQRRNDRIRLQLLSSLFQRNNTGQNLCRTGRINFQFPFFLGNDISCISIH